jgi:hypothetical protein
MRGECAFLDMYLWLCQLSFILNPYLFTPYHTFQLLPRSSEPYTHDEFCFQMIRTRTCACEDLNLGDWVVHSNNQVSLIFFVRYEVHLLNGSVINWYVYLLLWKLIGLGLSMAYEVQVAVRCSDCSFMMALKLQGQKERRCGDHLGGILPFVCIGGSRYGYVTSVVWCPLTIAPHYAWCRVIAEQAGDDSLCSLVFGIPFNLSYITPSCSYRYVPAVLDS